MQRFMKIPRLLKDVLNQKLIWEKAHEVVGYKSGNLIVKVNSDFPLEPLYTLYDINNPEHMHHFNDWPENWKQNVDDNHNLKLGS